MPIRKLLQGVVSSEQLAEAQRIFDEACREYDVDASNEAMRLGLAEAIISAYQASFPLDRLPDIIARSAASLGLTRRMIDDERAN